MKKLYFFLFIATQLLFSCRPESDLKTDDNIINIKGSEEQHQMISSLARAYREKTGVEVEVSDGVTSAGFAALSNGHAEIACSKRPIEYFEIEEAKGQGVTPVPFVVAIESIAIISHPKNKIDSISTIELQAILSGEVDNWKELGGSDRPINFYGRNENSETFKFLEKRFARYKGFSDNMIVLDNNKDIIEAVLNDTFAISFVEAGFLMDEKRKPNPDLWAMYLYIDGETASYSPYEMSAIVNGKYPLVRPLFQYINGIPEGKVRDFLEFELSEKGIEIISQHGYYPLTPTFESENESNGIGSLHN